MCAYCFEVVFIALHVSYCHSLLSLCYRQARGHRLPICNPEWQLLALFINVIFYTWQEIPDRDVMIKRSVFIGVRAISLWPPVDSYFNAETSCFSPFSLKPVIMTSPTCQPEDAWIPQESTVTYIINKRHLDVFWKNVGIWDPCTTLPNSEIDLTSLNFHSWANVTNLIFAWFIFSASILRESINICCS